MNKTKHMATIALLLAVVGYGIYTLMGFTPEKMMDVTWIGNVLISILGAGGYLVYKYKNDAVDWVRSLSSNRTEKVIEKTEEVSQLKDEEAMRYLSNRASRIEDSKQRQEMLETLSDLDRQFFELHFNYKPEDLDDV